MNAVAPPQNFGQLLVLAIRDHMKKTGMRSLAAMRAPAMEKLGNETLAEWKRLQKPKTEKLPLFPMAAEKREALFAVLCDLSGVIKAELTSAQLKTDLAIALNEIRRASPTVEEPEIRRRAACYLKAWPGLKFTALGLAKHWAEFSAGQPKAVPVKPHDAECPNWRDLMADTACRVPNGHFFTDTWTALDDANRREAWKRYKA